jgi:hypothetical protein
VIKYKEFDANIFYKKISGFEKFLFNPKVDLKSNKFERTKDPYSLGIS